ncbi:hypothetical protein BGX27_001806 [Mortierella sp. AM989]|nr:hypothetical protein BGX27_001806 [Mortierella sp. AM989]
MPAHFVGQKEEIEALNNSNRSASVPGRLFGGNTLISTDKTTAKGSSIVSEPAFPKRTSWSRRSVGSTAASSSGAVIEGDELTIYRALISLGMSLASLYYMILRLKFYFVYRRHGEADYRLDGPHVAIEAGKNAFQTSYKDKFDVDRIQEQWIYRAKTCESFDEIDELEKTRIFRGCGVIIGNAVVSIQSMSNPIRQEVVVESSLNQDIITECEEPETIDEDCDASVAAIGVDAPGPDDSEYAFTVQHPSRSRPQKRKSIFRYKIKSHSFDEVSGVTPLQQRNYESDNVNLLNQNKI